MEVLPPVRKESFMKKFKKMMALVLVALMCLVAAVPMAVFAAAGDEHTISVAEDDTHTYDVYQILTGDLSGGTLSNIAWGSSVNTPTDGKVNGKTAAEFAKSLEGMSGVDAVAEVAKYFTTGDTQKVGQVTKDAPLTVTEGYYVMVDVTDPLTHNAVTDTKALNVIRLADNVTVAKKWGSSTDTKTIVADTQGKDGNTFDPGVDTDNVSIGDTVNYNIAATVPENADKFKEGTFFFVITDKLSEGLDFQNDIKVYVGDSTTPLGTDKYTVKVAPNTSNNNTFEIGLINAAQYKGQTINVKYSAVLNEKAKIGEESNPNTSNVQFSNDPNKTYDGSPEDQNNLGFPDSEKNVPTGVTPNSVTETFTTGIEIQKVDENGEVLTGAEFTITGDSTEIVLVSEETFRAPKEGETADYYKLKGDKYTKEAPVTADYMEEAAAGADKGYVEDANYTGEDKVVIGDKTYRPYKPAEDQGKQVYVLVKANADLYEETTANYVKDVTYTQKNTTENVDAKAEVGPDGVVRFVGLGAGTYTITETKTPAGYNTIAPITVDIAFTDNPADGANHWSTTSNDAEYNAATGVFELTIENQKGSELPSTGGIGTTLFYVIGTILILGAGILLVTRRRMRAQ